MEIRRCILIGAESTGKTELAKGLARSLPAAWSAEYVRTFIETRHKAVEKDDLQAILKGQLASEKTALTEAAVKAWPWVVYDTNAWMTTLYARELYGVELTLPDPLYRGAHCIHLLCQPDIPWTPDPGQRDGPAVRAHFHQVFKEALHTANIPYQLISGTGQQRLAHALAALS